MQVLHSIPSLSPESGGTARAVSGLCTALGRQAVGVDLITLELGSQFGRPITPIGTQVRTTFVPNFLAIGQRQLWSPQFGGVLRRLISTRRIEIVHDHCIWLPTNLDVTREARYAKIPLVVSTRGMLEPWAFNHNGLRKHLMWHLYQARTLARVDLLHATAMSEAYHLRQLGLKQPIVVIPDAVEVMPHMDNMAKTKSRNGGTILFLGRIHPVKGLLNLINALEQVNTEGWEVLIAGPDEGGHLKLVQNAVVESKLQGTVRFVGPLDEHTKWQYYQTSDLFVLPSFTENFGIVVAEALASGVPVITTTGTPWHELVTTQSGWWVEPTVEALATALQHAMTLTDDERRQMGCNGKRLIQQNYSWEIVSTKMVEVYQWLLGQRNAPDCIHF